MLNDFFLFNFLFLFLFIFIFFKVWNYILLIAIIEVIWVVLYYLVIELTLLFNTSLFLYVSSFIIIISSIELILNIIILYSVHLNYNNSTFKNLFNKNNNKFLNFKSRFNIVMFKNYLNYKLLKKTIIGFFLSKKSLISNFSNNWLFSTNHKRIAVLYFVFVLLAGFTGLILATIIRIELAYPGQSVLFNNAEKYLTVISVHGIVMVFFLVIPVIFGAFGNFLLPTQLGIRDVAFPRLNSFMYWFTPAGFVLLLHILFFDKSYNLTYYINYSDLRIQLRNKFFLKDTELLDLVKNSNDSILSTRFNNLNNNCTGIKLLFNNIAKHDFISTNFLNFLRVRREAHMWIRNKTCYIDNQIWVGAAFYAITFKNILTTAFCMLRKIIFFIVNVFTFSYLWESIFFLKKKIVYLSNTFFFLKLNKTEVRSLYRDVIVFLEFDVRPTFVYNKIANLLDIIKKKEKINSEIKTYIHDLFLMNSLNNWRFLKFEREVWRTLDDLSIFRKNYFDRTRFYTGIFEPETLISRVSVWMPNHLIPGWAFITPYSSRLIYTSVGKVDVALVVVLFASLGSVFSAVNYIITYRYIGAPIYKNRKELRSFFVDGLLVASRMMLLANPALIIGILLLLSDRHFNTSVFDFSGGGDTILFQHLFWFFGHPEVYIIVIPCFGFLNSILPYYLKKRLSGRLSLQFSMYTIAFMGFAVWGHHMYMVGLSNSVRSLYSTMTVMISVPASTKILHWCVTLINTSFTIDVTVLFLLAFMYFFVLGGLSGMFLAHIGFDILFHDTFFVIGHFHVMLAGAVMSCVFGAFYFYFAAIFGVAYNRIFAYLHFFFYFFGQIITLTPMFWLGYCGMPRRIMDYPESFGGWQSIVSSGHLLIFISIIFFLFMLIFSFLESNSNTVKTRGVGRLSTRLFFYTYEARKSRYKSLKNLYLQKKIIRKDLVKLELLNYEYAFVK